MAGTGRSGRGGARAGGRAAGGSTGRRAGKEQPGLAGTVIAQHGRLSRVQLEDRVVVVPCRRSLRWLGEEPEADQVVVGDRVQLAEHRGHLAIAAVNERSSCLQRQAIGRPRPQLIAANVDQALVVMAAVLPIPRQGLLDRFLVACHAADLEAVVVLNKADQGLEGVEDWIGLYRELGHRVLVTSALSGQGVAELASLMCGCTSLLCGPSGAGKSTLLNAIHPGLRLKTGPLSSSSGKGQHTTSRAELLPLPSGGFVVDTPGLKELGLWGAGRLDIEMAFTEIHRYAADCRYANCSHTHEPACAVETALADGRIDPGRFASYLSMITEPGRPGR